MCFMIRLYIEVPTQSKCNDDVYYYYNVCRKLLAAIGISERT